MCELLRKHVRRFVHRAANEAGPRPKRCRDPVKSEPTWREDVHRGHAAPRASAQRPRLLGSADVQKTCPDRSSAVRSVAEISIRLARRQTLCESWKPDANEVGVSQGAGLVVGHHARSALRYAMTRTRRTFDDRHRALGAKWEETRRTVEPAPMHSISSDSGKSDARAKVGPKVSTPSAMELGFTVSAIHRPRV